MVWNCHFKKKSLWLVQRLKTVPTYAYHINVLIINYLIVKEGQKTVGSGRQW